MGLICVVEALSSKPDCIVFKRISTGSTTDKPFQDFYFSLRNLLLKYHKLSTRIGSRDRVYVMRRIMYVVLVTLASPLGPAHIGYTRDFFCTMVQISFIIPIQNQWQPPQNYPACQPSGTVILNLGLARKVN